MNRSGGRIARQAGLGISVVLRLLLATGCVRGESESGSRGPGASDSLGRERVVAIRDLQRYEAGRRAEIRRLSGMPAAARNPAELDSIGAAASGLEPMAYRELVERVDGALERPGAAPAGRQRLADSLRTARLILLIRTGAR